LKRGISFVLRTGLWQEEKRKHLFVNHSAFCVFVTTLLFIFPFSSLTELKCLNNQTLDSDSARALTDVVRVTQSTQRSLLEDKGRQSPRKTSTVFVEIRGREKTRQKRCALIALTAGLPDFSWSKHTKNVKNIPNDHKLYQKAINYVYQMAVKYSNLS
jgi:hypothetical protein